MYPKRTIYYVCPDNPGPSGGVRRIYRHVEILNAHGLNAFVLHNSPDFKISWFETSAPRRSLSEHKYSLSHGDVVVIPEVLTGMMKSLSHAPVTRVALALNWAFIYGYLPLGEDWRTYGITQAIAGSQYEREFILATMGIDAHVLVSGTDCDLFFPEREKLLQIAYMPRKNSFAPVILGAFRAMYPQFRNIPFVSIDGLPHKTVARLLRESAIFLTATFPEGLARPPLEAMASGCIVVGFAGRGSLEYMRHGENCLRADDGDVLAAANLLAEAITAVTANRSSKMQDNARSTAKQYDLPSEERGVLAYWTNFAPPPSPAALML